MKRKKSAPRVTAASFGRTINVGGYESVRIDLTAEVRPGETHAEVMKYLRGEVSELEVIARCNYAKGCR